MLIGVFSFLAQCWALAYCIALCINAFLVVHKWWCQITSIFKAEKEYEYDGDMIDEKCTVSGSCTKAIGSPTNASERQHSHCLTVKRSRVILFARCASAKEPPTGRIATRMTATSYKTCERTVASPVAGRTGVGILVDLSAASHQKSGLLYAQAESCMMASSSNRRGTLNFPTGDMYGGRS